MEQCKLYWTPQQTHTEVFKAKHQKNGSLILGIRKNLDIF